MSFTAHRDFTEEEWKAAGLADTVTTLLDEAAALAQADGGDYPDLRAAFSLVQRKDSGMRLSLTLRPPHAPQPDLARQVWHLTRVAAAQLTAAVNDRRIVTELNAMITEHGGDPVQFTELTLVTGSDPTITISSYRVNEMGFRFLLCEHPPEDHEAGLRTPECVAAIETGESVPFLGQLPTWWNQAAKLIVSV